MSARPATSRYGMKLDTSTGDYVECQQCGSRFVGGDFQSRLSRWSEHADLSGCVSAKARRDQELAEPSP